MSNINNSEPQEDLSAKDTIIIFSTIKDSTVIDLENLLKNKILPDKLTLKLLRGLYDNKSKHRIEKVEILLRKTKLKKSLFFDIINLGESEIIQGLIALNNMDINIKDDENKNALFYSLDQKDNKIFEIFLNQEIDFECVETSNGHTPLSYAVVKNKLECVNLLVKKGANINHCLFNGNSIMHLIIMQNSCEMFDYFANLPQIRTDIENNDRKKPLDLAMDLNNKDIENVLSKINKKYDENTHKEHYDGTIEMDIKKVRNLLMNYNETNFSNPLKNALGYSKMNNFTINDKKDSNVSVSISFKMKEKINENPTKIKDFIEINKNKHVLNIDLSTKEKQDSLILNEEISGLKSELERKNNEISKLNIIISKLKEEEIEKNQKISSLGEKVSELKSLNERMAKLLSEQKAKMEDQSKLLLALKEKNEKLMKEIQILQGKSLEKESQDSQFNTFKDLEGKSYLEKKFSFLKYDDKYSVYCLNRDLLDFKEYTKLEIKKLKEIQGELIRLVQESITDIVNDYEAIVFGSYATNLCLPWSDIDIVLIPINHNGSNGFQVMRSLYMGLLKKSWKKQIKFIDNTAVPLIKIIANDEYNNFQIDISLQDQKHYGLQCVELVKAFLTEYEVLEPLVFSLKNILKFANLNDPYKGGLSSYGLILMIVSFLQSQIQLKRSVSINDLGLIFLEFLYYYGYQFDHSKFVIYANLPNEKNFNEKEFLNAFQNNHDIIIIDPLSKTNNVAKSTFQYSNIKMAFMIAFVVAHESCECGCHYKMKNDNPQSTEHCVLKRIFLAVKRFNSSNV